MEISKLIWYSKDVTNLKRSRTFWATMQTMGYSVQFSTSL